MLWLMTQVDIEAAKADIDSRFNATKAQMEQRQQEVDNLEVELHRLQGEHRVYSAMVAEDMALDPNTIVAEAQEVEVVKPKKEK